MKKVLLIALGLLLAVGVNAQIRWGVKAGGNVSEMTVKINDDKQDYTKARFGFHVGGVMEYTLMPSFAIQPELLYIYNGTGIDETLISDKSHINMHQLQLPINAKYWIGDEKMKFYVTAGPYLGLGLSAKQKFDGDDDSVNLYGDDGSLKRFDFGIGVGLGFEISKFTFGAGYQFGIVNLSDVNNVKNRMGTLQFGVGYFF